MTYDHAGRSRYWAIRLTERPSETGTSDEAGFGPWLAEELRQAGTFGDSAEVWSFPVALVILANVLPCSFVELGLKPCF